MDGFFQHTSKIVYVPRLNQSAAEMRKRAIEDGTLPAEQAKLDSPESEDKQSSDDK